MQALPNPKLRYKTVSMAVVVLHVCTVRRCRTTARSWKWKKMDCCCALPCGDNVTAFDPPVTTAGRFMHWLTWSNKVVTLDVKQRCFVESWRLPERVRYKEKRLVEYKGGLGLMCQGKDAEEMELWANPEKKMVVRVRADLDHPTFKHFCNNDIVFVTTADAEGGAFYNLSNSSVTKVQLPSHLRCPYRFHQRVFPFKSDVNIVHLKPVSTSKTT
ncbi:hypothetical protein SASPL_140802 [Salvia splendens]|uniref:Uncharacterized protein n=1 Tax=Salvia splendens TaxID=180675 RepID=A0A8X8ZBZ1_SALSN|nr:hypothetical protein SASPL_140802 [Salvia splendens]